MPIYKQTTEITNIDDLLSSVERDIEEIYFGDKQVFTVWNTYDGTLPTQYSANGSTLADYRLYGSAGGVGDRTENLFNAEIKQGSFSSSSGVEISSSTRVRSIFEDDMVPEGRYTINAAGAERVVVYVYDATYNFVSAQSVTAWRMLPFTFTINNAYYVRFAFSHTNDSAIAPTDVYNIMLTEGSTAPAEYVPYGYKLNMGVKSANLLDFNALMDAPSGKMGNSTFQHLLVLTLAPNTAYTLVSDGTGSTSGTGDGNRSIYVNTAEIQNCVFAEHPVQITTDNTGVIKIAFASERTNAQQYINGTAHVWLVKGSDALPYQPYSNTTIPIYIGGTPLGEDEYVDYQEGKIYRSQNLYDANATDTNKGYISGSYLYGNTIGSNQNWFVSEYMPILASTDYIAAGLVDVGALGIIATINIYNSNKQLERYETINSSGDTEINSGVNGAFIRISARIEHKNTVVVKTKNATPTDPPVPLPALPTVDGTNIVDYVGQSAAVPSRFVAKYRKEGFK